GVEVFDGDDAAQGGVGDVHAEVGQLGVGRKALVQFGAEGAVHDQDAEVPAGDDGALVLGLGDEVHDLVGLAGQLRLDALVVQGLQQLGGQKPVHPQQQKADE